MRGDAAAWSARAMVGDAPATVACAYEAAHVAPYRERPARTQRKRALTAAERGQDEGDTNLWHGGRGRSGGRGAPRSEFPTRVSLALDAGETMCEDGTDRAVVCVHFAGGCCTEGARCQFLHRAPLGEDERRLGGGVDCFGRERHARERPDMRGTGCLLKPNKSLYVNYAGTFPGQGAPPAIVQVEELTRRDFGEFGPIAGIHVVPSKTLVFVRYYWRCSAEFAKEAMHARVLQGAPAGALPLAVRWAFEDPNPRSQQRERNEAASAQRIAAQKRLAEMPPDQLRAMQMQRTLDATGVYPDTSAQYTQYVHAALGSAQGPQLGPEQGPQMPGAEGGGAAVHAGWSAPAGSTAVAGGHVSFDPDEYEIDDGFCDVVRVELNTEQSRGPEQLDASAQSSGEPQTAKPPGGALAMLGAYGSGSDAESD